MSEAAERILSHIDEIDERSMELASAVAEAFSNVRADKKSELKRVLSPFAALGEEEILFEKYERGVARLAGIGNHKQCPAQLRNLCESALDASPKMRLQIRAFFKKFCDVSPQFISETEKAVIRAISHGTAPGSGLIPTDVADLVLNLMSLYGAWRTLGVVPIAKGITKLAKMTGEPTAYWITPGNAGSQITADAAIAGDKDDTNCPTLACLINVSTEMAEDGRITAEGAILEALVTGMNKGLDWACFMADGSDDTTDGLQTGIFAHAGVSVVDAAAGNTTIATLDFTDFSNTIAAVSPKALQRPCRWWINPAFLPALLPLKDGNEKILRGPNDANGNWMLAGFPVTWTAASPNENAAAKKIAAFGRGDAFSVAMRNELEIRESLNGQGFITFLHPLRAVTRAQCKMRDAASFAILKTAAA